jgi:hypothetical protein
MAEKFLFTAHGFGVDRTSTGLFSDVAQLLPDHTPKMMSFYKKRKESEHNLDVMTHAEQAELLLAQMKKGEGEKILLAHSMGNVALAMVVLSGEVNVDTAIMMAPALDENKYGENGLMNRIRRIGGTPNPDGVSVMPRTRGGNIFLPPSYFVIKDLDLPDMYQQVAERVPTIMVRALHDKFVDHSVVAQISGAYHIALDADHNFNGASRPLLIDALRTALAKQGIV